MNYELKFYFGPNTNEVQFLGSYKLADLHTFNHYKNLINSNVPFGIWFEHYDSEKFHRNFLVDNTALRAEGLIDNDETTVFFIVTSDPTKIKFLTKAEYNDQNKINELINQISKESIARFF